MKVIQNQYKSTILLVYLLVSKFRYLEFRLLLVTVTIEPGCSLLTVCYHELFDFIVKVAIALEAV